MSCFRSVLRCSFLFFLSVLAATSQASDTIKTAALSDIVKHPLRSASATSLSVNDSVLSSQLLATVLDISVLVSQKVKRGDVLLHLDCSDYTLALRSATAKLAAVNARRDLAKSQRDRSQQLLNKALASQEQADIRDTEYLAQTASVTQAKVDVAKATLNVERCTIKAPFDAVVTQRRVAEGQLAKVGTALLSLVDTERLELSAKVNPDDIAHIMAADQLVFDYGKQLVVLLHNVGGVVDPSTRNQELRFRFLAAAAPPGSAGKLVWRDARAYIPAQYVIKRGGQLGVFTADNNQAIFVALPQAITGRAVPVDWPLETVLIIDGLGNLSHGQGL